MFDNKDHPIHASRFVPLSPNFPIPEPIFLGALGSGPQRLSRRRGRLTRLTRMLCGPAGRLDRGAGRMTHSVHAREADLPI